MPAPGPVMGVPDHFVFLPEDIFFHSHPGWWADLIRLPPRSTLGVVVRLEAELEAVLVWMGQVCEGGRIKLNSKSARSQRQHNKR